MENQIKNRKNKENKDDYKDDNKSNLKDHDLNINNLKPKLQTNDIPKYVPIPKSDNILKIDPLSFYPELNWLSLIRLPGIIVFGIFIGYIIGYYKLNPLFLFPIAHIIYYIFMRRINAYKRSIFNLVKINFKNNNNIHMNNNIKHFNNSKKKSQKMIKHLKISNNNIHTLSESVEWLNYIIRKMWEVGEEGVSANLFAIVNNILAEKRPKLLTSLQLRELTLGTRPPNITCVRHIDTEDGICLEFGLEFTPIQTDRDILAHFGEERRHWNTCIELVATVGFVTLPILVRNFVFSGIFRTEIMLGKRIPFIERISISAIEKPIIDFELYPLGMADVMDLPYLARALRAVVDSVMDSQLLTPNCVEIILRPFSGRSTCVLGVAHIFVGGAKTRGDQANWIEISVNGITVGRTKTRTGAYPIFNENFWVDVIGTVDQPEEYNNEYNNTNVPYLPKHPLHSIDVTLVVGTVRYNGKLHCIRDSHAEQLHCGGWNARRFVDLSVRFFPTVQFYTRHAIFVVNIVGIKGLRAIDASPTQMYSTYCQLKVEYRDISFNSKPKYICETRRSFSTRDPLYNETCRFFLKNYDQFVLRFKIISETDGLELGFIDISVAGIINGSIRYQLAGVAEGELELDFCIHYIDLEGTIELKKPNKSLKTNILNDKKDKKLIEIIPEITGFPMIIPGGYLTTYSEKILNINPKLHYEIQHKLQIIDYTKVFEISLIEIDINGCFYIIVETKHLSLKSSCFSSILPIITTIIVPLTQHEKYVRLKLFQLLERGDVLLDDIPYDFKTNKVQFGHINLCLISKLCDITIVNNSDTSSALKIIQFIFTSIGGIAMTESDVKKSNFTIFKDNELITKINNKPNNIIFGSSNDLIIEITTDYGTIVQDLPAICTILCGTYPPICQLRRQNKLDSNFEILATFSLPLLTTSDPLYLSNTLIADICLDVRRCSIDYIIRTAVGSLELYFIKIINVPVGCNPYLKIYCNDEKIYKTSKKFNNINPVFNETCKLTVDKDIDIISCFLNDYSTISPSRIIAYLDIPLLNIKPGYFKYSIQFKDYLTNLNSNIFLHFIACFVPTLDNLKIN